MQIFDLELIKTGYFDDEVYANAEAIYNRNGVVHKNTDIDMMTDAFKVSGTVTDEDETCDVYLEFAKSRYNDYHILVGERSCSCNEYSSNQKNCAHMATFLMFLNNYTTDEIKDGTLGMGKTSKEIDIFEEIFMKDFEIAYDKSSKAMIEIHFEIEDQKVRAFLKIGQKHKKKYIVKDAHLFCEMFKDHETMEYGKLFTFKHSLNNIEQEHQYLVKLLIDIIKNKPVHKLDPKYFDIGPAELEILFGILINKDIFIKRHKMDDKEYRCVVGSMPFELHLSEVDDMYVVNLQQVPEFVWFSHNGVYSLSKGTVSFFTVLDYKIYEFMEAIYSKPLKIMKEDFFSFYDNVLTEVSKHMKIVSEFSIKELYKDIYKFDLYVDTTNSHNLKIDAILKNDNDKVDFNFKDEPSISYSKSEALKLTKTLTGYGRISGGSIIIDDNNLIYDFCTSEIKNLSTLCNRIYTSERFKNIKIIDKQEVNVGVKINNNLLNIDVSMDDIDKKEIIKMLKSFHAKNQFYRLENGNYIELDSDFVRELNDVVANLDLVDGANEDGFFEVDLHRGLYLNYLDSIANNITLIKDSSYSEFLEKINNIENFEIEIPDTLQADLKPYQIDGFKFLKTMHHLNFGAILADDMGLGKTIQVITVMLSAKEDKPSLVVCPSSLIFNWANEFEKFAPSIDVITINEDGDTRKKQHQSEVSNQVIITSYELLKRDFEHYENIDFQYFVIDESHYIKNNKTQNFKTVKEISADFKIALTGTPIENSLSELWSLFDFTVPGYLGTYAEFSRKYEVPILKEEDYEVLGQLKTLVKPFILRRLKSDVLDELPSKNEHFVNVDLYTKQSDIYKANLIEMKDEIENTSEEDFNKNKLIILAMLTKLRQLSCDPALIYEDYNAGSAKLEKAIDLIKNASLNGQKTLLFSQFTSMLDIIAERLDKEGISYYMLNGSTKKDERYKMTQSFNEDETQVFLISLKAGGTGLNLVGASNVIHFDPWWNMSAQNQATDRVYRIGQKQDVEVYKLISNGTIEEKIVDLQAKKSKLAENMLSDSSKSISQMSKQDLLDLFT